MDAKANKIVNRQRILKNLSLKVMQKVTKLSRVTALQSIRING
jgi:hypothetical protein